MGQSLDEAALLPASSVFRRVRRPAALQYLSIQALMLALIWSIKQHRELSLFFPGCVALLMITRQFVLPRLFTPSEMTVLDPPEVEA